VDEATNRATNADYQVYNGPVSTENLVASTTVNQQLPPDDFLCTGLGWEQLAVVTPTGSTITVRLDNNANGYVVADALQARPINAPQAVVTLDGANVPHQSGTADFGVTSVGTNVTRTFTVQNQGSQPLELGTITVDCSNFSVTQFGSTTLNLGESTTFTVTMHSEGAGPCTGTVSFATNDPAKNPFVFQLAGEVTSSAGSPWIIDNGDAGYWTSCCWTDYSGLGYDGDLQYAVAGNGSIVADWTFTGLTPGQAYELATTWTIHTNRATNAPYSLYNGAASSENLVSTTLVNQQLAPNDFSDSGAAWERIGVITPTGNTVTVRLSDLANGFVIADAVRIAPTTVVAAPEIAVQVDGNHLPDGTGSVAFGTTTVGTAVTKTFTVQNVGTADLTLGAISVSSDFTASAFGTTTVAAGGSTTFTVTLIASNAGNYSGTVSFATNDPGQNPFDFTVSGTVDAPVVSPPMYLDNGQSGYTTTGSWVNWTRSGYLRNLQYTSAGTGSITATWSLTVTPGDYLVSTTWQAHSNRTPGAPYSVYDGSVSPANLVASASFDQRVWPSDLPNVEGVHWQHIGVVTITGTTLTVRLTNAAPSGYLVADGVRIEGVAPLRAAGEVQVAGVDTVGLTQDYAEAVLSTAVSAWTMAGITQAEYGLLQSTPIWVMDLPGNTLGGATSVGIFVDPDAAGYGWNLDLSAMGVLPPAVSDPRSGAFGLGGMDLLTVMTHELGHVLGLDDLYGADHADDLMSATLPPGVRRLPLGIGQPLLPGWATGVAERVESTDLLLGGLARGLDPLAGFGLVPATTSRDETPSAARKSESASDVDLAASLRMELDDRRLPPDSKSQAALVESDDLDDLLDLLTDRQSIRQSGSPAHDEIFADWDR
jgi:hypothetical protein